MKREVRDLFYSLVPKSSYLQRRSGNTNIMLTAPHGGGMKPRSMPKRRSGVLLMDTYTRRLTSDLWDLFEEDNKPYAVISDLHRSRLDLNRTWKEACDGNYEATRVWESWDWLLRTHQDYLRDKYERSIYIDIHSHNDGDYIELGYNLSAIQYNTLMKSKKTKAPTTVDSLSGSAYSMLFGVDSINTSLTYFGFEIFKPENGTVYFNGGRNVEVYSGNGVGAIQIECPVSLLRTKHQRKLMAMALKYSITNFRNTFASVVLN